MRTEKMLGQQFTQLVTPSSRRKQILEFGHDLGGHMSPKKSGQRIRMNFWWPSLRQDLINYVQSCATCQLRARKTCWDRVPIQAIPRHDLPFMHWFFDILGPLSSEKLQYPYCLVMLDSMTRFPVAFAIKSPTAKNVCDCLVQVWTMFGVPRYVSADNATCNVASLTQELCRRCGVSPRFITPHHSEGNAPAERLIGTTKRLIAKVAADHPRSWQKHLPFVMWALREVPSSLTGAPPWLLAMGTLPRGPLAVLRETWTGERDSPPDLSKSVTEYLRELHQNLEIARTYADMHSKRMQNVYVRRYNERSRDKHFDVGDSVLILQPSSTTSRMFSTWSGPGKVIEKRSPYSYVVELDGARYRLHANQLRHFSVRVDEVQIDNCSFVDSVSMLNCEMTDSDDELANSEIAVQQTEAATVATCAIVRDEDADFGDIRTCEPHTELKSSHMQLPSQRIDLASLNHLTESEQQQLLAVLDKYPDVFRDEPGLYTGVEHSIPLNNDFRPKRMKEYKIPEKIKPEVHFCGKIVGSGIRRVDPEKVAAVDTIRVPETKKQVRQVLGFFNFFRDSIPHFAAVAKPLTDLTKKGKSNKIALQDKEMQAFCDLKMALKHAATTPLHIMDLCKDFDLLVDASNYAVAGVLTQPGESGANHPVAFFSWKLDKTQQGWSTVEKEAYAALKSLQRVKQWVFGRKITVHSDHNPLTYLTESSPKSAKLLRWALALQEFEVSFQYRAGKDNVVPDLLSRM